MDREKVEARSDYIPARDLAVALVTILETRPDTVYLYPWLVLRGVDPTIADRTCKIYEKLTE